MKLDDVNRPNQPKKHLIEIIQNAENMTFGSGTADTAPAHPILPLPTHSVADPYTVQIFLLSLSPLHPFLFNLSSSFSSSPLLLPSPPLPFLFLLLTPSSSFSSSPLPLPSPHPFLFLLFLTPSSAGDIPNSWQRRFCLGRVSLFASLQNRHHPRKNETRFRFSKRRTRRDC